MLEQFSESMNKSVHAVGARVQVLHVYKSCMLVSHVVSSLQDDLGNVCTSKASHNVKYRAYRATLYNKGQLHSRINHALTTGLDVMDLQVFVSCT